MSRWSWSCCCCPCKQRVGARKQMTIGRNRGGGQAHMVFESAHLERRREGSIDWRARDGLQALDLAARHNVAVCVVCECVWVCVVCVRCRAQSVHLRFEAISVSTQVPANAASTEAVLTDAKHTHRRRSRKKAMSRGTKTGSTTGTAIATSRSAPQTMQPIWSASNSASGSFAVGVQGECEFGSQLVVNTAANSERVKQRQRQLRVVAVAGGVWMRG